MKNRFLFGGFIISVFFPLVATSQGGGVQPAARAEEKLYYPELVNHFYQAKQDSIFWLLPDSNNVMLRRQLLTMLDTAYYYGQAARLYHYKAIQSMTAPEAMDTQALVMADRICSDAAIALLKDIYQGYHSSPWVSYDQLSATSAAADNEYLLGGLLRVQHANALQQLAESLEPAHAAYTTLKNELRIQKQKGAKSMVASLILSMNYYRWIHHFRFQQFIVVNIPAARLQYFEKDAVVLDMKTVVGKPATTTPLFATWCDQAILYPYWYVPPSIIFNEYLPKIKANPSWLDAQRMQVVNGSGKIMDHHQLNWASFGAGYFPYSIRQSTGCDNALGVIKFNIITPFGVYLHDTNNKTAFLSGYRFYSHGCIRLEQPIELGNKLLAGKLDTVFLQSCFKEQKPVPVKLKEPVPVFVVYMPVSADASGKVWYYKDVYKLVK